MEVNSNVFGLLGINSEGELPRSILTLLALKILSKKWKHDKIQRMWVMLLHDLI